MLISQAFPSKYIKSEDIKAAGRPVPVVIDRVEMETIGQGNEQEEKPVLYFRNKSKGMVLNVTNGNTIKDAYGDDTDSWLGQPIELYVARVSYAGKMMDGLRVQLPSVQRQPAARPAQQMHAPAPSQRPAPPVAQPPYDDSTVAIAEDDIPFHHAGGIGQPI